MRTSMTAVAAAIVLGLAVGGCGDSESEGKSGNATGADSGRERQEKKQISTAFYQMQKDFYAGDGEAACAAMTAFAQRQAARLSDPPRSCARNLAPVGKRSADQSFRAPNILAIEVAGSKATVIAKKPKSEVPRQRIPYAKEGGGWKMARLVP